MTQSKRILFIVDHKHRDLPGLALIGYYLSQNGHKVKYVALWQEDELLESFDPHVVVLPKPVYNNKKLIKMIQDGRKRVVIHTEGAKREGVIFNIDLAPDLFFFWNESEFNRYKNREEYGETKMILVGSPRIDFLNKRFEKLYLSREDFLTKHGLDPSKKTITISTHTVASFHSVEYVKFKKKQLSKLLNYDFDYDKFLVGCHWLLDYTVSMLEAFGEMFPEINFILKPHPNENVLFWSNKIKEINRKNIAICLGENINQFLVCSDIHVAHNGCTTTAEAVCKGIPTIEIFNDVADEFYPKDRLKMANHKVRNHQDMKKAIIDELRINRKGNMDEYLNRNYVKTYLDNNFYKRDGLRCLEYALEIDRLVDSIPFEIQPNTDSYYSDLIKEIDEDEKKKALKDSPSLYRKVRGKLGQIKRAILSGKELETTNGIDINVDGRGRVDNRIREGDAEEWFDKYSKAGFKIEELTLELKKTKNR